MLILLPRKKKEQLRYFIFKKRNIRLYVSAKGDHRPHLLDVCHHATEGKLHHLNAPFFFVFLSVSLSLILSCLLLLPTYTATPLIIDVSTYVSNYVRPVSAFEVSHLNDSSHLTSLAKKKSNVAED
jgi:hypothetical protein